MTQTTFQIKAVEDVCAERDRQDVKWGAVRYHPWCVWMAILTEEVGEAAERALNADLSGESLEGLRAEMVQVGAVAVAVIEHIDRLMMATSTQAEVL